MVGQMFGYITVNKQELKFKEFDISESTGEISC